jgi:small subunit ribosomal protein S21
MLYKKNFRRNYDRNSSREPTGLKVEVRNGDVNKALRRLKKMLQADGTMQEIRDRQYYEKPSEKRRKAKKAGIARYKKKLRDRFDKLGY